MYNAMLEKKEVTIGQSHFYIAPFPAFVSVRVSASLTKTLAPVLGGVVALFGGDSGKAEESGSESILDMDITDAMPAFAKAMESINPDEWELTMRLLLIDKSNIAIKNEEYPEGVILSEDIMNSLFAKDVTGLFRLAFEVIKLNFGTFFDRFNGLSGHPTVQKAMKTLSNGTGN
ncbi:MAG: phage tail assembly chaperone [Lachnospiraceae bacterium]